MLFQKDCFMASFSCDSFPTSFFEDTQLCRETAFSMQCNKQDVLFPGKAILQTWFWQSVPLDIKISDDGCNYMKGWIF